MTKKSFFYISWLVISILVSFSCTLEKQLDITPLDSNIQYSGRVDSSLTDKVSLFWSGSSILLNFEGNSVEATLSDDSGNNYYNILVDDQEPMVLKLDTIKKTYSLAKNLKAGKHTIEIFKRTEWDRGTTTFYGFQISGKNAKSLPYQTPTRSIEFYGNSITAGYAIEDLSGQDRPDSTFTNSYLTYATLTARHYDAKYSAICKSGIGVTVSWFPLIMDDIYDKLNPRDSTSKWNFSLHEPDITVINLLQNDSWIVELESYPEFKHQFGTTKPSDEFVIQAYKNFITKLRNHYPNTHIICTLGSMDAVKEGSKWPQLIIKATSELNDSKVYTHFYEFNEHGKHPTIDNHKKMSESLIQFIDKNIKW